MRKHLQLPDIQHRILLCWRHRWVRKCLHLSYTRLEQSRPYNWLCVPLRSRRFSPARHHLWVLQVFSLMNLISCKIDESQNISQGFASSSMTTSVGRPRPRNYSGPTPERGPFMWGRFTRSKASRTVVGPMTAMTPTLD